MSSTKIIDLKPIMRPLASAFLKAAEVEGLAMIITCTFRSMEEQAELYKIGRTKPGRKVTNALPGQSSHNYGLALDGVPLYHGKPAWKTTGEELKLWNLYGELAEAAGLEWAGRWTRFREFPHVQMKNWRDYI